MCAAVAKSCKKCRSSDSCRTDVAEPAAPTKTCHRSLQDSSPTFTVLRTPPPCTVPLICESRVCGPWGSFYSPEALGLRGESFRVWLQVVPKLVPRTFSYPLHHQGSQDAPRQLTSRLSKLFFAKCRCHVPTFCQAVPTGTLAALRRLTLRFGVLGSPAKMPSRPQRETLQVSCTDILSSADRLLNDLRRSQSGSIDVQACTCNRSDTASAQ